MSRKRRKRRWHQFSLRALLVFVLLLSIGMSWLAVRRQRGRRQREALEAIWRAHGQVEYGDGEIPLPPWYGRVEYGDAETPVPSWWQELLGDVFFRNVHAVYLGDTQITDAELDQLKWLRDLEGPDLPDTQVTDAGLEHLQGLTRLEWLHLFGTQVTDAGVNDLKRALPNCNVLH